MQGRTNEAISAFQKALALDPGSARAHAGHGAVYARLNHFEKAAACYWQAVHFRPDYPAVWNALGTVNLQLGLVETAIDCIRMAVRQAPSRPDYHATLLYALHYEPSASAESIAAHHHEFNRVHGASPPCEPHSNTPVPDRPLRIGYVSPDFHYHPVPSFFEPLARAHDQTRFPLTFYSSTRKPDAVTDRLRPIPANWREVAFIDDAALAAMIRADSIDILVDLSGHTSITRVGAFTLRPAPVQVTYLGYPNSTGLTAIDYRFTDKWADPPGAADSYCTEELIRLPHGFLCYQPPENSPDVGPPPCLTAGRVTFGGFCKPSKWSDAAVAVWAAILNRVPESRLLLHHAVISPAVLPRLFAAFLRHGIAPHRLELVGYLPEWQHLNLYNQIDIALDPFPYAGTTQTCEALWMGLPVVSLAGNTHASRVGVSLLNQSGLPGLIAESHEAYVELAAGLAADPARLSTLRSAARESLGSSALLDASGFAASVESAFRSMWLRWCSNHSR